MNYYQLRILFGNLERNFLLSKVGDRLRDWLLMLRCTEIKLPLMSEVSSSVR